MNESGACLAITEKRPQSQRPGGCVGIFFQLFDWNRKFAKKKLFSKRLLAPARAMKAAKSFGGDEKMPKAKHHLIADENVKGFPNLKKNGDSDRRHEMKAPSLVARLMGLESMPAAPKKALLPESIDDGRKSFVGFHSKEDLSLEKGAMKLEPRPQKLQKTGEFEKHAVVTRFGAEAFQMKNVLSRSRKHRHSKLASPVKSPRVSSGKRNVSRTRLIDVATRILEPGLQATNKARSSLTYHPASLHYPPNDEVMAEVTRIRSPEPFESNSTAGQTSCKNCGESLDVMDFRSYEDQQYAFGSPTPNFTEVLCEGSGRNKPRSPVSFMEPEKDSVDQYVPLPSQPIQYLQARTRTSPSKPGKPQKDETSNLFKSRTQAQNRVSLAKDRDSSRAKYSDLQRRRVSMAANAVTEPKDFVSLNRNLSGQTRPRAPYKVDNSNLVNQRKFCDMKDDFLPKLRKRRTLSAESTGFSRSKLEKGSNFRSDRVNDNKDGDVVSFSFNSPLRKRTGSTGFVTQSTDKRREQNDNVGSSCSLQDPLPLHGDALSALLEQKLKELTSQEEDEFTTGTSLPKRSTAIILQELIAALNAEKPISHDFHMSSANTPLQAKVKNQWRVQSMHDCDHFSPGSVLEAPFSNDSCFSSSMDESSGPKVPVDCTDFSLYQHQPLSDTDLSDSATSWDGSKTCTQIVSDLVNHISKVVQSMNLSGLTEAEITHAREVIFKTELLFGNATKTDLLVGPFLLDELERFVHSTRPHYIRSLGLEKAKEGLLKRFLFGSMIESFGSRYGLKTWSGHVNERVLVEQIDEDVRKWTEMVGKAPDEIVEWEMGHGLGKWIDFDAEVSETGEEIDSCILQDLLEEIVLDL